jgi:hypothetical protein
MKDTFNKKTVDLLDGTVKRGRGRPRVDKPLTAAERMQRARIKKQRLLTSAMLSPVTASNLLLAESVFIAIKNGYNPNIELSELCKRYL